MMEGEIHVESNQTLNQTYKMNLDRLNMKVDIDPDEMSRAQLIVDSVNKLVYNKLKTKFPQFKMRSKEPLILQGSVADGTKVLNADEFDYMIPMDLNADQWGIQSCDAYEPPGGYTLIQRNDHARKVCNGDLGDGSQYFANVELPYNKNMRLHARKDTCSEGDKTLLYHRNGLAKIKNVRKAKVKKRKSENTKLRKKRWTIGGGACKYCKLGNEISSHCVFHGFKASLYELQDYVDIDKTFRIAAAHSALGPVITLTVSYKQSIGSEETTFNLKIEIDYAPTMCIDGRYFVPKTGLDSKYWRECFADEELRLMNEIQTQDPQLFELYRSYKALLTAVYDMSIPVEYDYSPVRTDVNESSFNLTLLDNPAKLVSRLLCDDEELRLEECLDFNYGILLDSYHLKMALLQVWGSKKRPTVDEEEFVIAVKNATTDGFIRNYFNGNHLKFVFLPTDSPEYKTTFF